MRRRCANGARVSIAVGALLLAGASGCTFLSNRGSDAKQMMDLGLTFSKKPQFGLYANCPMVTPVGYSKVDGTFVGMGGGKLGAGEHHQNNAGMLFWGREENSWKGMDKGDKATVESHRAGVVGIAQSAKEGTLKYRPACVHYLHLGFVGVMWNLNYFKMADFFCGWAGYVPFGDRNELSETRLAKADKADKVAKAERVEKSASPFRLGRAADAPGEAPPAVAAPVAMVAAKAEKAEKGSSAFTLGPPAEVPSAPRPAVVASAKPTPPVAPPAPASPTPGPAAKPAPPERPADAAAGVSPVPPDEIALAVARDVAAMKAEMAALRRAQGAVGASNGAPASAAPAAAPPKMRFPVEQLVP